jgi:arginine-tRNA-protein transferase
MRRPVIDREIPLRVSLHTGGPHRCPYVPGQIAVNEFLCAETLDSGMYQSLMELGFRRSGDIVYRPRCPTCRQCVPIRVVVDAFRPTRSQRRARRRNADVRVTLGPPEYTGEKWKVYRAYLQYQHGDSAQCNREEFEAFLYRSPTTTVEMTYWLGDRLLGAGIVDQTPSALSSVYFYFDPAEARRSLGVFSALVEIDECRRRGLTYWYVGYYVGACHTMRYKAAFGPHELLGADGVWRRSVGGGSRAEDSLHGGSGREAGENSGPPPWINSTGSAADR